MATHTIISKLAIMAMVLIALAAADANGERAICGMSTDDLFSCRPSVVGPAPLPPSAACCAALAGADMACLCSFKTNKLLPALGIDPALAMQLPSKCNLPKSFHC